MRLRSGSLFQTARTEGGLLPADLLQRVADNDGQLDGLKPSDYHLAPGERLNEAITRSWNRLLGAWRSFDEARGQLAPGDRGGRLTRERWLHVLFDELGYGRLVQQPAIEIEAKSYPVFSQWQHTPIHLVGCGVQVDTRTPGVAGAAGQSPHSLLQELLNRSPERLWGIVSNGLVLRVLRDNVALTRQAYLEFDLEGMFSGEVYPDFVLLWLVCHQSRVEAERPEDCWLERWTQDAAEHGTRALDALRDGVQEAIEILGAGFLAHPANHELHTALRAGTLEPQDYYRQLLRLVYRLLFLFVAEDRDALLDPAADKIARERYSVHYSTQRLRSLAQRRRGGRQHDRYEQFKLVMAALHSDGCPPLGLPALGSYLWSPDAIAGLTDAAIANEHLLDAIRSLATVEERGVGRSVDFRNLGAEELGSIYESLLELHPELDRDTAGFALHAAVGSERKTTGSYYTPTSLITSLLDSALEPVLDEAAAKEDPHAAVLDLKVCDPACGSGHFLIAAANRVAKRLAAIRTGDAEPSPEALRSALRDVVGRCIHGVDMNPMAVELCKVSLWMEALDPGRPLSFLDDRLVRGNSLLGTTPELIAAGVPPNAFKPLLGDSKDVVAELRKRNDRELKGQMALDLAAATAEADARALAQRSGAVAEVDDRSLAGVSERERRFRDLAGSPELERARLLADTWCAAFVAPKRAGAAAITQETVNRVATQGAAGLSSQERALVDDLRDLYGFHHWHVAFPAVFVSGGFDVVLGNPPWEHTELKEKEFFAVRAPEIADAPNKAAREKLIAALDDDDPPLSAEFRAAKRRADGWSHMLRSSGRYPLCGRGRTNTYAVFAELMRTLVGPPGRVGVIVPTGIATDDTTKHFFRDLVERWSLVSLLSFENEAFVFPQVHHATKFCLLTLTGGAYPHDPEFVFFARRVEDLNDEWRRFTLSPAEILALNPNTGTCPTFRSRRDAEVTKGIYHRVPPLVCEGAVDGDPWGARFVQGLFNMSSDSGLFLTEASDDRQPLYEGKMFWQFDHRFGTYDGQTEAQANQGTLPPVTEEQHRDANFTVAPRYFVARTHVRGALTGKGLGAWLVAFRDITFAVNERTMIFSALPAVAIGHPAPLVILDADLHERLAFLACANSFAADYVCRQKVGGTHLPFFVLKQVAMPSPSMLREVCPWAQGDSYVGFLALRALELVYTAHDLDAIREEERSPPGPFVWDAERRSLIRAELDGATFHLYGVERDGVEHIMSTFPVAEAYEVAEHGEFRQRRLILERYDAMAAAAASGTSYETVLDPPRADPRVAHEVPVA
jgi:hypothetical protein